MLAFDTWVLVFQFSANHQLNKLIFIDVLYTALSDKFAVAKYGHIITDFKNFF